MAGEAMSAFVRFFVKDEVSSEVRDVERAADRAADSMDEAADAAGKRMAEAFDKAKGHATNFAKGLAGVSAGAGALLGGMVGLANSTADFQEDMGKLETAFEDAGHSVETAKSTYNDLVGILGETDQSVEAANHLAELTSNTQELSQWGTISAGVYAKFGDSLPLESLTEATNHTAKLGEVQGPLADALEWAGKNTEEFNAKLAACNSEEERASLITSTLNEIYGEAGQAYQENNADLIAQRQAQSDFNAALTEAGNVIRPLVTDIMNAGTTLITWLKPPLEWFIANLPTIAPIVTGIVTAFLAFQGVSAVINGVKGAMTLLRSGTLLMTAAQAALNLVMSLNPFAIVAAIVLGLVAAIVVAWNTSEDFRNAVMKIWDTIKNTVSGAVSAVKNTVSGMVSSISGAFSSIYNTASSIFNNIKTAISNAINTARDAVSTAISKIKGFFNFSVSLPKIKLPHFSIKPSGWKIGDLLKGSIPSLGISWYAKGAVFDQPTLFATNSGFKGVGEAGAEAVAPISVLMDYVRKAVSEAKTGGYVSNINITTGETNERKLAKLIAREEKRQAYALGVS